MAEKSLFWSVGAGGDGATAYTQAELIRWQRQQWINDNTNEGVHKNYAQAMLVSGTASPINIATGAATIYGFPYWNTTNVSTAVPTPVAATRTDRITLRATWASTSVRLYRIAGVEGAGAPAMTQTDGVAWDVPLARVAVSTSGAITVTDDRTFLHPNIEIETAMIADDAVTTAKIPNRTRRFLVPFVQAYNTTNSTPADASSVGGWDMDDNTFTTVWGHCRVPSDYSTGMSVAALVRSFATGTFYGSVTAFWGLYTEAYNQNSAGSGTSATGVGGNAVNPVNNEVPGSALGGVSSSDHMTIVLKRDAVNASDTIDANVVAVGAVITYTADS